VLFGLARLVIWWFHMFFLILLEEVFEKRVDSSMSGLLRL
jgi:hypothetical protein